MQVEARDLGNNFLLEKSNLGKGKAHCMTEALKELNPSISGNFVEDSVHNIMASNIEFFQSFELVIATQVTALNILYFSVFVIMLLQIHACPDLQARRHRPISYMQAIPRTFHRAFWHDVSLYVMCRSHQMWRPSLMQFAAIMLSLSYWRVHMDWLDMSA